MPKEKKNTTPSEQSGSPEGGPSPRSKRRRLWIVLAVIAVCISGGGYWWFFIRGRVTTEDAYVRADIATISSRVAGTVLEVLVEDDQPVEKGQILLKLDPTDYHITVKRREAVLEQREADMRGAAIAVSLTDNQTQGQIQAARATFQKIKDQEQVTRHQMKELERKRIGIFADFQNAKREYERMEALYRRGAVSQEGRDTAETLFKKADADLRAQDAGIEAIKASLKAIQQEINQAEANLKVALSDRDKVAVQRHQLDSLKAQAKEARAELDQAKLDLSYCTIVAPITGHVAKKAIQVGDRIQSGEPVMAVVPLESVYVEANFKETQLEHVRLGQHARIEADIYPGYTFQGKVVGIGAGTGAAFSLLPPENATGNWIKIVQRVPVRIELDAVPTPEHPLRVGLSLKVTIDFRNS